ncbi:E3 SUMO-protein ligase pli1 [Frankliniella fusca]|uniref:E3 SUMO-protein ligase pli1 n=1 Tax=Frankliniella fusca TaxID=407009 RepID=A0AAE1GPW7_9NEOP|nr:E3 SUMO-protein ligase pli1 [Frankliniella fusca]
MDLDIRDPVLERDDVHGGDLDVTKLHTYLVPKLERLLRIFGLPSKGNKQELIDRIKTHIARGKGEKVNPGFEEGQWHQKKRRRLMDNAPQQTDLPVVPIGTKQWNPFPSVHIPEGFHYYNILDYFENIPQLEYSYKRGVLKSEAQTYIPPLHDDTSDDDSEDDDDDECHEMTFQDLCRRAVKKCIKKGEQFLFSGRLLSMLDTTKDKHYFIKSQVQASMEDKLYGVVIILNVNDGSICTAECSCKAQALKRCGHIAAVLLRLWQQVFSEGYEGSLLYTFYGIQGGLFQDIHNSLKTYHLPRLPTLQKGPEN